MELEEQIALITGAAQGIGKAIATEMAKTGANVILTDTNEARLKETYQNHILNAYRDREVKSSYLIMDVTNEAEIREVTDKVVEQFGQIDILVNNAGVLSSHPVVELEEKEWDRIINVNLKGTFLVTKTVLRHMMKRRAGRIVNIASDSGITGKKYLSHYCSSKFGVVGFTQSVAQEAADYNILVNAICPGPTATEIYHTDREMRSKIRGISKGDLIREENERIPLGRPAQPEEVARLVIFLASKDNTYITGEAINVSGGFEVH